MKFFDHLMNFVTNLGVAEKDKHAASFFSDILIDQKELNAIYKAGGIGGKVVDCVAEDLGRVWRKVSIPNQDSKLFKDFEKQLQVRQRFTDEVRWSRLNGGAVIIVDIEGDEDVTAEPLNPASISKAKPVTGLRVAHKHEFSGGQVDLKTGRLEQYILAQTGEVFHPTRVLGPLDGIPLPVDQLRENMGWGCSVLGRCYQSLLAEATAAAGTSSMMEEAKVDVISVKALSQYLDGGARQAEFEKRYALAAKLKSITNLLLLDADVETYETKSTATAIQGLAPLLERFANRVAAETDIPMTRLFGKLASGLSTSGETNQQDYYDMLTAFRTARLEPQLDRLDVLLLRSVYNGVPDGFEYTWQSFREMSEPEKAEVDKKKAETAEIYLEQGVVVPAHVARSLADAGQYSVSSEFAEYMEERDGLKGGPDGKLSAPEPEGDLEGTVEPMPGEGDVQQTAMNGAQVQSLVEIAKAVRAQELEYEQALAVVLAAFPGVSNELAQKIVKASTPPPVPPEGAPVPPQPPEAD